MKKLIMLLGVLCIHNFVLADKIGLVVVATGKYISFVPPLLESARKYFCTNHKVTYFIFTDGQLPAQDDVVVIYQKRLGWPHDTMMRFGMYDGAREHLEKMDYIFATDADMLFVDTVGDEILSDRVATQHPGFVGKRGTYETRSISTAYIAPHEGEHYFAGGFYGGSAVEFLKMVRTCLDNVKKDLEKNFIAIWHDESHLNRYFVDHKPTKILTPSYCYVENWNLPYKKRLMALVKKHEDFRN